MKVTGSITVVVDACLLIVLILTLVFRVVIIFLMPSFFPRPSTSVTTLLIRKKWGI